MNYYFHRTFPVSSLESSAQSVHTVNSVGLMFSCSSFDISSLNYFSMIHSHSILSILVMIVFTALSLSLSNGSNLNP